MELKLLCPQWGHEDLDIEAFFEKVKKAGYDGVMPNWPRLKCFCLISGIKTDSKKMNF